MLLNKTLKNTPQDISAFAESIAVKTGVDSHHIKNIVSQIKGYSNFSELTKKITHENNDSLCLKYNAFLSKCDYTSLVSLVAEMDKMEVNDICANDVKPQEIIIISRGKAVNVKNPYAEISLSAVGFYAERMKNINNLKQEKCPTDLICDSFSIKINDKIYSIYFNIIKCCSDNKKSPQYSLCFSILYKQIKSLYDFNDDLFIDRDVMKDLSFKIKEINPILKHNNVLNEISKCAGLKGWNVHNKLLSNSTNIDSSILIDVIKEANKINLDNFTLSIKEREFYTVLKKIVLWMFDNTIKEIAFFGKTITYGKINQEVINISVSDKGYSDAYLLFNKIFNDELSFNLNLYLNDDCISHKEYRNFQLKICDLESGHNRRYAYCSILLHENSFKIILDGIDKEDL